MLHSSTCPRQKNIITAQGLKSAVVDGNKELFVRSWPIAHFYTTRKNEFVQVDSRKFWKFSNVVTKSSTGVCSNQVYPLHTHIIFLWLTHSWSWALLEKLPLVQLLKKFSAFYGTRRFITVFTRALHWSLSWARSIQYFFDIHLNILITSTNGSHKIYIRLNFSN
jgi:hypothetical protein